MHQVSGVTAVRFHLQTHRTTRTFLVDSSPRAFFQLMLLPPMIRFFEQRILFFPKKRRRRKTLLFFTRQYRPRVVLFNFFFTTVDSCRTDSRTHIRSNALMLGSSLSLSGEERVSPAVAREDCAIPLPMPIFSERSPRWKKDRRPSADSSFVDPYLRCTIYRGLRTYSRAPVDGGGGSSIAVRAAASRPGPPCA